MSLKWIRQAHTSNKPEMQKYKSSLLELLLITNCSRQEGKNTFTTREKWIYMIFISPTHMKVGGAPHLLFMWMSLKENFITIREIPTLLNRNNFNSDLLGIIEWRTVFFFAWSEWRDYGRQLEVEDQKPEGCEKNRTFQLSEG